MPVPACCQLRCVDINGRAVAVAIRIVVVTRVVVALGGDVVHGEGDLADLQLASSDPKRRFKRADGDFA